MTDKTDKSNLSRKLLFLYNIMFGGNVALTNGVHFLLLQYSKEKYCWPSQDVLSAVL